MNGHTSFILSAMLLALLATFPVRANDPAANFRNPPETTNPYCYWFLLNGDSKADGITKDLKSMAKMGIRQAMIVNIESGGRLSEL